MVGPFHSLDKVVHVVNVFRPDGSREVSPEGHLQFQHSYIPQRVFSCIDDLLGLRIWSQVGLQTPKPSVQGHSADAFQGPLVNLIVKVIGQFCFGVSQLFATGQEVVGHLLDGRAVAADSGELQDGLLDTRTELSPGLSVPAGD